MHIVALHRAKRFVLVSSLLTGMTLWFPHLVAGSCCQQDVDPCEDGLVCDQQSCGCRPPGDTCGNGVLDPEEECDPAGPGCGAGLMCDGCACVEPCVGASDESNSACIDGDDLICGECAACGDGTCDVGESCRSCPTDCGRCPPPPCGDGLCQAGEDCNSCPADCGCCPHSCQVECADHNGGSFTVCSFDQCRAAFGCGTGWNGAYGQGSQPLGDCGLRAIIYDGTSRNTDGSGRSGPFPTYDCAKCANRDIYHRATGDNPFPAYPNDCIGLSRTWANSYCNEPGKDRGSLQGWLVGDCAQ